MPLSDFRLDRRDRTPAFLARCLAAMRMAGAPRLMDTWIVDVRHFMAQNGLLAPNLPKPARVLAEYWTTIVAQATVFDEPTSVRCRRRPQRRPCQTLLYVIFDDALESVLWHCPKCGDNGAIRGWQGTFWDNSEMPMAVS